MAVLLQGGMGHARVEIGLKVQADEADCRDRSTHQNEADVAWDDYSRSSAKSSGGLRHTKSLPLKSWDAPVVLGNLCSSNHVGRRCH